ncbi:IS4 family transposase [Pirellulaceae bacterium SH449]
MLAPRKDAPRSRPARAKLNRSSRTKTPQANRKAPKKKQSLNEVRSKVKAMLDSDELLLPKLFDNASINAMLSEIRPETVVRRNRLYTIPITISLFVQQVLSKNRGCKEVITLLNKQRKQQQLSEVSTNTTSYCEARMRIPLELIERLNQETARLAFDQLPADWRWRGHRVLLVDGLVVNAPDTPENQKKYPQPSSKQAGLGFPQVRLCVSVCLTTGIVTNVQYGPVEGKKTGETTLFRKMFDRFRPGDIVVADSNFESYRDMAMLAAQGVYTVCDKKGTRTSPFTGPYSKIEDKTVVLTRPGFDRSRFTREEWEKLPETMQVRIIRYKVDGRKSEVTIVTTLLDQEKYPAEAIAELYKYRWECELDIRSIKSVMGMDWLSCHTPEMLERELMVYFCAYNIIRVTMCDAAKIADCKPRDLSFKQAKDSWLHLGQDGCKINDLAWLLSSIAHAPLRKRSRPSEPRKIKHRNAKYEKLKRPRDQEKQALSP